VRTGKLTRPSSHADTTLAIETALGSGSLALGRSAEDCIEVHLPVAKGTADTLVAAVSKLAQRAGQHVSEVDRIVVTIGPGGFTGVRAGLAMAQGLMSASQATAYPISTLQALADAALIDAPLKAGETVGILMDAKRGHVYQQTFDNRAQPLTQPRYCPREVAVADLASAHGLAAGDGVVDAIKRPGLRTLTSITLSAARLIDAPGRLGLASVIRLRPMYLRAPDATPAPPVLPTSR